MGASLIATIRHDGAAIPDNSTVVAALSGLLLSTTQAHAWRVRGTSAVTVSHLRTYVAANTTLVTSTFTVRKNGTGQSLVVSYTSGQTGEKQDTTNSFSASAGDDVDIGLVVANDVSGAKTITVHSISVVFTPSTSGETISRIGARGVQLSLSTASATRYMAGGSPSNATSAEAERRVEILSSYTLSHLYTYVGSNARTTTTTCRVRVNGANGNQSVSYTSGQTGVKEDTSNTDSVASGDDVCWSLTNGSGSGAITLEAIECVALSATEEFELLSGTSSTGLTNGVTRYSSIVALPQTVTTESAAQTRTLAADYTSFRTYVVSNSADGTTTFTFRVEGADTALSIAYTSGQTGLKTDTDTVSAADDDLINYSYVSTSTSGTLSRSWHALTGYTASGSALNVNLSDSVTPSDALTKSLTLAKADTGNLADAVAKATALAKADSATTTDVLAKTPTLLKADGATASDAVAKALGLVKADAATALDALAKLLTKALTDAVTPGDALTKAATLAKADSATATDSVARAVGKVAADVASVVDALAKAATLARSDTASAADALAKTAALTLADTSPVADVLAKAMGLHETDAASAADAAAKLVGLLSSDTVTVEDLAAARLVIIRVILRGDVTMTRALSGDVTIGRELVGDVTLSRALSDDVEV